MKISWKVVIWREEGESPTERFEHNKDNFIFSKLLLAGYAQGILRFDQLGSIALLLQ
jgi:hypothetical protein